MKEAMGRFHCNIPGQEIVPSKTQNDLGKRFDEIKSPLPRLTETLRALTISDNKKEISKSPTSFFDTSPRESQLNLQRQDDSDTSSSSFESSESESDDDDELVAKCPDKLKENKKTTRPKPYAARDSFNSSVGLAYSQPSAPPYVYPIVKPLNIPQKDSISYTNVGPSSDPAQHIVVGRYNQPRTEPHNLPFNGQDPYYSSCNAPIQTNISCSFFDYPKPLLNIPVGDNYQIPKSVEEISRQISREDEPVLYKFESDEVANILNLLTGEECERLDKALMQVNTAPAAALVPRDDPQDLYNKPWKSVDSAYGTLSPGSSTLSPGGAVSPSCRRQHTTCTDSDGASLCSTSPNTPCSLADYQPDEGGLSRVLPIRSTEDSVCFRAMGGESPVSNIPPIRLVTKQPAPVLPAVRPEYSPITPSHAVAESGVTRFKNSLNKTLLQKAWTRAVLDTAGATPSETEMSITKAIRASANVVGYMENIFARVELARKNQSQLVALLGEPGRPGPLYIAAVECPQEPLIARLIADTIASLDSIEGNDLDKVYGSCDESLLHVMAHCGDSHARVLAELLNVKRPQSPGTPAFLIDRKNLDGETPLHVAVKTPSVAIVKLLRDHGAGLQFQDKNGFTPLISAVRDLCDPVMVKTLLQCNFDKSVVNLAENQNNTALHYAASQNSLPLSRQKQVISLLINSGARHDLHNRRGYVALRLVYPERKEEIKKIFYHKS